MNEKFAQFRSTFAVDRKNQFGKDRIRIFLTFFLSWFYFCKQVKVAAENCHGTNWTEAEKQGNRLHFWCSLVSLSQGKMNFGDNDSKTCILPQVKNNQVENITVFALLLNTDKYLGTSKPFSSSNLLQQWSAVRDFCFQRRWSATCQSETQRGFAVGEILFTKFMHW